MPEGGKMYKNSLRFREIKEVVSFSLEREVWLECYKNNFRRGLIKILDAIYYREKNISSNKKSRCDRNHKLIEKNQLMIENGETSSWFTIWGVEKFFLSPQQANLMKL